MKKIQLHIETERLYIKNLEIQHLTDFHLYRSNPVVTKYQGFDVFNMKEAKNFIESQLNKPFGKPGEWVQYAVISKSTMRLLGDCAIKLQKSDPRIAEVGITISHLKQKKGYAKEAFFGIISFLFDQIKVNRIVETLDAENKASIALLKSVNFRQEGYFIENIFFKGKWGSEYQYALLKGEWDEMKSK